MEYIRHVVYLNEYKEGKRQFIRPGFARLERRDGIWSISVTPEEAGIKWAVPLYIVGVRAGECAAYFVGEMDIQCALHEKLDTKAGWFIRELDVILGILIGEPKHYLAGECSGVAGEVSFETVDVWEPAEEKSGQGQTLAEEEYYIKEEEQENKKFVPEPFVPEPIGNEQPEKETQEGEVPESGEDLQEKVADTASPEAAGTASPDMSETVPTDTSGTVQPDMSGEKKEQRKNPFSGLQSMYPFEDDEMDWCYQIEPKDFGIFSAKEWHLASNSFLLQGYYNYRHLMFAHKKGKNYIGVPGQFHRREQYLASRFGFSQFKGTQRKRVTMGDFGYWMREID